MKLHVQKIQPQVSVIDDVIPTTYKDFGIPMPTLFKSKTTPEVTLLQSDRIAKDFATTFGVKPNSFSEIKTNNPRQEIISAIKVFAEYSATPHFAENFEFLANMNYRDNSGKIQNRFSDNELKEYVKNELVSLPIDRTKLQEFANLTYLNKNNTRILRFSLDDILTLINIPLEIVKVLSPLTTNINGLIQPKFSVNDIIKLKNSSALDILTLANMTYTDKNGNDISRFSTQEIYELRTVPIEIIKKLAPMVYLKGKERKVIPVFDTSTIIAISKQLNANGDKNTFEKELEKIVSIASIYYKDRYNNKIPDIKNANEFNYHLKNIPVEKIQDIAQITYKTANGELKPCFWPEDIKKLQNVPIDFIKHFASLTYNDKHNHVWINFDANEILQLYNSNLSTEEIEKVKTFANITIQDDDNYIHPKFNAWQIINILKG